jgi:hypothetical protein
MYFAFTKGKKAGDFLACHNGGVTDYNTGQGVDESFVFTTLFETSCFKL